MTDQQVSTEVLMTSSQFENNYMLYLPGSKHRTSASASSNGAVPGLIASSHRGNYFEVDSREERVNAVLTERK
jgi:hypothetical protein